MGTQAFSWLVLAMSVAAEVAGTIALRYADGFSRPLPSLVVGVSYAIAIWLMAIAVRHLEIGMAYAIWAGGGAALIALTGVVWFGESMTPSRAIGVTMIIIGVVVLNLETR
ncbi:DMT family transporter [Variovorax paradoxus]|uniref:Small multidrug resistance protein n=1 Tax=Variovorax paradoxus (strain EPS) TaxID=595537 RepID=E6UZ41_VARPE|nr:multidrug efflux SMR transporter [Variovorax paradoxus]ADU34370.1 small multidrug resistance protein [Variovorax paradoxus EPS]